MTFKHSQEVDLSFVPGTLVFFGHRGPVRVKQNWIWISSVSLFELRQEDL